MELFHHGEMASALVDDLVINVNANKGAIGDDTWDGYVAWCAHLSELPYVCTFAPWSSPSAPQRRKLSASPIALRMKDTRRLALLSESVMVRGAVTAMTWLTASTVQVKPFKPKDLARSIHWLKADPRSRFSLSDAIAKASALLETVSLDPLEFLGDGRK
jgi:hypothetical protein